MHMSIHPYAESVSFFIPAATLQASSKTFVELCQSPLVKHLFALRLPGEEDAGYTLEKCSALRVDSLTGTTFLKQVAEVCDTPYAMFFLRPAALSLGYGVIARMCSAAENTQARMVYADHYVENGPQHVAHPAIDYQEGSLRDDFDFGGLWLCRTEEIRAFLNDDAYRDYDYSACYALRLFMSRRGQLFHLNEYLYSERPAPNISKHEQHFLYQAASQQTAQKEYEQACTDHLRRIGAYLPEGVYEDLPEDNATYPVEASVIIPVKNRVRTIGDAIRSALRQEASIPYNIIVVDNHSTDGTSEAVRSICMENAKVRHLQPLRHDLGIGGCWDFAIRSAECGRFAVQLDSDDLYSGPDTLERIVSAFREEEAAMVVGAYSVVDFQLRPLPPGLIAHKEWTAANGRNNALRINGFGAPRAFRTQILRAICVPNTSYGEDYALGLAFSRRFHVARIYDELYLCRRWDGNSDAALTPEQVNRNNAYKDKLRTMEIAARKIIRSK